MTMMYYFKSSEDLHKWLEDLKLRAGITDEPGHTKTKMEDETMKKEIVKRALELSKCRITIDSAWCGHSYDQKEKDAFDDNAVKLIKKTTEDEFSEAYDECLELGMEVRDITAQELMRQIAGRAPCVYDNVVVNSVNCF